LIFSSSATRIRMGERAQGRLSKKTGSGSDAAP
jgi:hypothetical protein